MYYLFSIPKSNWIDFRKIVGNSIESDENYFLTLCRPTPNEHFHWMLVIHLTVDTTFRSLFIKLMNSTWPLVIVDCYYDFLCHLNLTENFNGNDLVWRIRWLFMAQWNINDIHHVLYTYSKANVHIEPQTTQSLHLWLWWMLLFFVRQNQVARYCHQLNNWIGCCLSII